MIFFRVVDLEKAFFHLASAINQIKESGTLGMVFSKTPTNHRELLVLNGSLKNNHLKQTREYYSRGSENFILTGNIQSVTGIFASSYWIFPMMTAA